MNRIEQNVYYCSMVSVINKLLQPYSLKTKKAKKLEGYISTNYKITDQNENHYVLKYYSDVSELPVIQEEIELVNKIKEKLPFQLSETLIRNAKSIHHYEDGSYSRLLTYIEGELLGDVEHTPSLLHNFGRATAQLDKALLHINAPNILSQQLHWDIQYALLNSNRIKFIKEPYRRKLVDYFLDQFEHFALPKLQTLRQQIIHNDLNDWNVLCRGDEITGFIDFGDVAHSALINESATALAYVMMNKDDPFVDAAHVIKGYVSVLPLTETELSLLHYLIPARLCTSVCHSAEAKSQATDTEYIMISEKGAWDLLEKWITWNPIQVKSSFLRAGGFQPTDNSREKNQLSDNRKAHFSKALNLSYNVPIFMSSAAFQYMYDIHGNAYLDAYNNIPLVGHSHPNVSRAVSRQIRNLNTNTRYHNEPLYRYAEKLLNRLPDYLNKVFFVNSGSEANELAQRLAQAHSGNESQIVLEMGYHGHSSNLIDLSSYKYDGPGGRGKQDHICELALPKLYNGKHKTANEYLAEAKEQIENEIARGKTFGAFIAEPISGCGGQVPIAKGYLKGIAPWLTEKNILYISDEVQVGFGRLGRWFWGFEMQNVRPDIVVLGKPMGNGFPVGAVVTTQAISESFENGMEFFSSFGGNPLATEAAHAVLHILEEEGLQQCARNTGDYLKSLLTELQNDFPIIGDIRGEGLFLGIEFTHPDGSPGTSVCKHVKNKLKENYILTGSDGRYGETLKIKPPLCFSKENADHFIEKMANILVRQ